MRCLAVLLLLLATPAAAQSVSAPPATSSPRPMPFMRATRDAFIFSGTATPHQFLITQPTGSTAYRAFNPCVHADVRIMSMKVLEPIVTADTAYPGVQAVTSKTEVIDHLSGFIFARGPESLSGGSNRHRCARRRVR